MEEKKYKHTRKTAEDIEKERPKLISEAVQHMIKQKHDEGSYIQYIIDRMKSKIK